MSRTYTVKEITAYIRNMFAADYLLTRVTVRGEISNYKENQSGHLYFTLKDEAAAISCVMFAPARRKGLLVRPRDGMSVTVTGAVVLYEAAGRYQINVTRIEDEAEGILYRRFLALKQELEEMGMFDPSFKKPVPGHALTVGIVTSPTGAALQDICQIAARRNPYVQLILSPARVQGEGAAHSIAQAIRRLDERRPDVMIVGRGGGSYEDLFCFNEEEVARAIFDCDTPVISAVGHEVDFTIADYVADLRAPTPSAAAELAVFDLYDFENTLDTAYAAMEDRVRLKLERLGGSLRELTLRLRTAHPKNRLLEQKRRLLDASGKLERSGAEALRRRNDRLTVLMARLDALSPLKKLRGGFGYVTKDGKALTSAAEARPGDAVRVVMEKDALDAVVTAVQKNDASEASDD